MPELKIYIMDYAWQGMAVIVASSEEEALKIYQENNCYDHWSDFPYIPKHIQAYPVRPGLLEVGTSD